MADERMRIAIGGDYLLYYTADELMTGGFAELLPHRDLLTWEFLPKGARGEDIESGQLEGFDALMLSGQHVVAKTLSSKVAERLVVVARMGAGHDNIDIKACTQANVLVFTSPHGLTHSTALGALSLLICVGRKLLTLDRLVRAGRWDERGAHIGADYLHHTLGVIGPGRIGAELIRLLEPFKMRVLVHNPLMTPTQAQAMGAEMVSLPTLMSESDFVCVTCALTPETTGLVNVEMLALMKPSAYLVNVARGAVVDQDALTRSLQEGRIAGAGLDVFVPEPLPVDHPLTKLDNVVLTPHSAASSRDMGRRGMHDAVMGLVGLAHGEKPSDIVNPEVWSRPGFQAKLARWARRS